MKQFLVIALTCCFLFSGCSSQSSKTNKLEESNVNLNNTINNDTKIDQDSLSENLVPRNEQPQDEESAVEFDLVKEKGTMENPYKGLSEAFQITCQIPKYGEQTEITVEFSYMTLAIEPYGALVSGNVRLIDGPTTAPIHLNDYIYVVYRCKNGLAGDSYIYDADSEDSLGFKFTENNKENGSIASDVSNDDLIKEPQVAGIVYYNGSEYKKIFFAKYEEGEPHGIR